MNPALDIWIDALKRGDEKAYRQLYDRYYDQLCLLAFQYVRESFLAESLVGDVIYHIWENRETLTIHTSLKAYLVKAVQNRCINYLEHLRVRRKSEQKLAQQQEERQQDYISDFDYPLARLIALELEDSITKAIDSLPAECREVFRLSRMEELSYSEISERLGISVNTVKYHVKNALAQLREQFKEYLIVLSLIFWNFHYFC
ncbi:MAG: RNA polymerase sigma-70 factor [Bacteroidales bacterium]|nr:RNA polymerase sigma-70 factor [Bacteroidales bacterium]